MARSNPSDLKNAIIQDIALAPRNARGMVEYVTDVEILRPADRQKGNGVLFFNVVNRGNKHGIVSYNADVPQRVTDLARQQRAEERRRRLDDAAGLHADLVRLAARRACRATAASP